MGDGVEQNGTIAGKEVDVAGVGQAFYLGGLAGCLV